MKWIKKVAVTVLDNIAGAIIDSTNITDKVTNTYSARVIEELINANKGLDMSSIADILFPIGRGFLDFTDTDYSNWLGLTWERTLLGVSPVGYNPDDVDFNQVGKTGGEKTHTMTEAEMFPHKHDVTSNWFRDLGQQGKWGSPVYQVASDTWTAGGANITSSMSNTGGGQPMNNMDPYQVVSYWKRVAPKVKISFSIYDITYQAEEGMTFGEWLNSSYNTDGWTYYSESITTVYNPAGNISAKFDIVSSAHIEDIIEDGKTYTYYTEK